jgi:hypothetical protein
VYPRSDALEEHLAARKPTVRHLYSFLYTIVFVFPRVHRPCSSDF